MKYRSEIDGLRAIAVVPVVLFHAGFELFGGGFVGVDVFFVISGYLITSIIISDMDQDRFSIANFYERRARRILPALVFVILICLPFAWAWLMPRDMKDFGQSLISVAMFSSNIVFWLESGYFDAAAELKPLLHTWSLAVEEQYYILFPLLLMAFWARGKRTVLLLMVFLFVLSFALAEWQVRHHPAAAFYLLPTRAWELLIGAFAAFALLRSFDLGKVAHEGLSLLGLSAILYSVFSYDRSTPFPGVFAIAPAGGTALVILFARQGTLVARVLSIKIIVGLGLISYSIYLWHQPLLVFARHRSLIEPSDLQMALLCIVTLPLAYLTWRYVEAPFRDKAFLNRQTIFKLSAVILVCFAALGAYGQLSNGLPQRIQADALAKLQLYPQYRKERDDGGCNRYRNQVELANCVRGDNTVTPEFALVGDSHGSTLQTTLGAAFAERGMSYIQYTKNNCPFAFGLDSKLQERCGVYLDAVYADLKARGIKKLILVSRWAHYLYDSDYENGSGGVEQRLKAGYTIAPIPLQTDFEVRRQAIYDSYIVSLTQLLDDGFEVFLVTPIPEQGWDVPKQLAKHMIVHGEATVPPLPHDVYMERQRPFFELLEQSRLKERMTLINAQATFCTAEDGGCPSVIDGKSLYYDDDHLSNYGAQLLVDDIIETIAAS